MNTMVKVTKAQRFNDILAMLEGNDVNYGTTLEEAKDFINNELTLIAKKNSGHSKKDAEKQAKDEELKVAVLNFMMDYPDGVTCTEVFQNLMEEGITSTSKATAIMRKLKDEGKVERVEVKKGKVVYKVLEGI